MTNWKDYKINGRDFKDLIHPSGTNDEKYFISGENDATIIKNRINFKNTDKILEYGCGNGRILKHLQDYNIYGVDLVKDFIDDGKKQNIKNLFTLEELKDNDFKYIFAYTVFIHLNDEDTEKALKYIYDKLNKDGLAFLQIPIYEIQTNHDNNFICVRSWTLTNLNNLLKKIGFQLIDYKKNKNKFDYLNIGEYHDYLHIVKKI